MRSIEAGGGSAPSVVITQPASQAATTAHERTIARRFIIRRLKDASFRQKSQSCRLEKDSREVPRLSKQIRRTPAAPAFRDHAHRVPPLALLPRAPAQLTAAAPRAPGAARPKHRATPGRSPKK